MPKFGLRVVRIEQPQFAICVNRYLGLRPLTAVFVRLVGGMGDGRVT